MKNSLKKRIISLLLVISLTVSLLSGCGKETENSSAAITTEPMQETGELSHEEISSNEMLLSTNVDDYIGNVESFVYGALSNHLKYIYDVFPGTVVLDSGLSVFGLAYTDYSECYVNEDESENYFVAGFMPAVGEITIPEEDFQEGLLIENLDFESNKTKFILGYLSDAFSCHCVVFDQYVTYGINDDGQIFYTASAFDKNLCDESLGALYSYDEGKYLLDVDLGEFTYLSGESLVSQIDYAALEAEINQILENQDINFVNVDIETKVACSQEAVTSYLLSLQEETFLGYDVDLLVEEVKKLDPMECYRLTSEGLMTIDLEHSNEAEVARWLVGASCVIAVAVGLVSSMVFITCPGLSAVSGAVTGTAIEMFMQIVTSDIKVQEMDWNKVAIAATVGAVSGFAGPYISAANGGLSEFCLDTALDGLMGGIEQSVLAYMDGESGKDIAKSFGYGFAIGVAVSAGFKGATKIVGKVVKKIAPALKKLDADEVIPKLTKKASTFLQSADATLNKLRDKLDSSIFHSEYIADKLFAKQLDNILNDGSDKLTKRSLDRLKKDDIYDMDGNLLPSKGAKARLKEIFDSADNNSEIGYFVKGDEKIFIKKTNGMVTVAFDDTKYLTVTLDAGLKDDREDNFTKAAEKFKEEWIADESKIPKSIADKIDNLEDITPEKIKSLIKDRNNGWVMHENADLKTITLVARDVHDSVLGGISHMGGFGLCKYIKTHMGTLMFERFVSASATATAQAAN